MEELEVFSLLFNTSLGKAKKAEVKPFRKK